MGNGSAFRALLVPRRRAVGRAGERAAALLALPPVAVTSSILDDTLLRPGDQFAAAGSGAWAPGSGPRFELRRWPQPRRPRTSAVVAPPWQPESAAAAGLLETIARAVVEGLGGGAPEAVSATVEAISAAWSWVENFALDDDVLALSRPGHGRQAYRWRCSAMLSATAAGGARCTSPSTATSRWPSRAL